MNLGRWITMIEKKKEKFLTAQKGEFLDAFPLSDF